MQATVTRKYVTHLFILFYLLNTYTAANFNWHLIH